MIPALDSDAALGQAIAGVLVSIVSVAAAAALWVWSAIRDRRRR